MSSKLQSLSSRSVAAASAAGLLWALSAQAIGGDFVISGELGNIPTEEVKASLDRSGATATVTTKVPAILLSATEHSPPCHGNRLRVADIPVMGNTDSNCVRVCISPPDGYEIWAANGVRGSTSHAYSQVFNPEWFSDTKKACAYVKNWSAHQGAVAVLTVDVCKAGQGCASTPPPESKKPDREVHPSSERIQLPTSPRQVRQEQMSR